MIGKKKQVNKKDINLVIKEMLGIKNLNFEYSKTHEYQIK